MVDWASEYLVDGYADLHLDGYVSPVDTEDLIDAGGIITFGTKFYLMRGIDIDCGSLTYRTWVVVGDPDFTGSKYIGTKCGASPLSQIIVANSWTIT